MVEVRKKQQAQLKQRELQLKPISVSKVDESAIWHHLQQDNHFPWI